MAKRLISLSGKVKRLSAEELDADRYQYLSLEQAEPNPGNPASDGSLFISDVDGTRGFTTKPSLTGVTFRNNTLGETSSNSGEIFVATYHSNPGDALSVQDDSVGFLELGTLSLVDATDLGLQEITQVGNTTNQGIEVTGVSNDGHGNPLTHGVTITSPNSLSASGKVDLTGPLTSTDTRLKLNTANLISSNILTTDITTDSVGYREALFAFVAPTLDQVTEQSIASGVVPISTPATGAITEDGIRAKFFGFGIAPPGRSSVDARTALVYTGIGDSVGQRTLTDLAVQNTTTDTITVDKIQVSDPSIFTLPASGTIPLVVYEESTDEYEIVQIDVENLDANFETLKSVTARKAPTLDSGETDQLTTLSNGLRLRGTGVDQALYPNNTERWVLVADIADVGPQDSAYVNIRQTDPIAFNQSIATLDFVLGNDPVASSKELTVRSVIADSAALSKFDVNGNTTLDATTIDGLLTVNAATSLDSTTIDAGVANNGFVITNLAVGTESDILAVNSSGVVSTVDLDQELSDAVNSVSLHDVVVVNTSSGRTTSGEIGAADFRIYDGSGFVDDDDITTNFNVVIDTDRDFHVQDKIFFNDLDGSGVDRLPTDTDRNFIRFSDPTLLGYPGVYDFVSDALDDPSTIGNALIRAGGLILTDSATIGSNLTITGNLTVNGTETVVNTTNLSVTDKKIVIADNAGNIAQTADAGIYLGADDGTEYASFTFDGATSWTTPESFTIQDTGILIAEGLTLLDSTAIDGALNLTNLIGDGDAVTVLTIDALNEVGSRAIQSTAFTGETLTTVTDPGRPAGYDTTPTPLYFNGGISLAANVTDTQATYKLLNLGSGASGDSVEFIEVDANILDGSALGLDQVLTNSNTSGRNILLTGTGGVSADSGDFSGKLNVDGDITTAATTFNLLNTTATTVNVFGDATGIGIGAVTGTTTIRHNLDVDLDLNVDGGDITTAATTFNLLNTNATTVNAFGAATSIDIGAATGTTSINNNLDIDLGLNVAGITTLDSTTIDAGVGNGLVISNLQSGNGSFAVVDGSGNVGLKSVTEAFADENLQTVTQRGQTSVAQTTNVSVTTENVKVGGQFFLGLTDGNVNDLRLTGTQKALHIDANDSVGFRDLGNLAYLDSDDETFASLTSKPEGFGGLTQLQNNTVVPRIELQGGLNLKNLSTSPDDNLVALFLHQDSVVKVTVDETVFRKPSLQEVTEFGGDSTNIKTKFGGSLNLPAPGTELISGSSITSALAGDANFYQMLIIDTATRDVSRGNIATIVQTVSTETLETVTSRGALLNDAAGKGARDSATVQVDFGAKVFYSGVDNVESTSSIVLVLDGDDGIAKRDMSTLFDGVTLHEVTTAGPLTSNGIGIGSLSVYTSTGFVDPGVPGEFTEVIDADRNAFFVDLDVTGITTLDSTAIDAGVSGNGLSIPNLGEVTTNTDILTINGDVVSKTAFSDIYTVPPTPTLQSVTDAGNITDNFIRIRSTTSGGNVYLEVLDSGTNPDLGYHLVAGATSFQQFETNEAGSSILNASTVIEAEDSDKTTMAIIRHGDTVGGPSLILAKNRGTNKSNKSAVSDNDNLGRIIFGGASNTTSTEEADPYTPSFEISADVSAPVAYDDLASTMRWFSHDGGTKTQVMSLDNNGELSIAQSAVIGSSIFIGNSQATNVPAAFFGTTNDPNQGYVAVTHNPAGGGTSSMSLAVSNTGSGIERVEISPTKMQLKSSVQLQDAAGTNLVIYDSAGVVLWGNV